MERLIDLFNLISAKTDFVLHGEPLEVNDEGLWEMDLFLIRGDKECVVLWSEKNGFSLYYGWPEDYCASPDFNCLLIEEMADQVRTYLTS